MLLTDPADSYSSACAGAQPGKVRRKSSTKRHATGRVGRCVPLKPEFVSDDGLKRVKQENQGDGTDAERFYFLERVALRRRWRHLTSGRIGNTEARSRSNPGGKALR